MEKLEVANGQKKEVITYNENKFVEVGTKFAQNIYLPKDYDVVGSMKALHLMCISSQSGDLTKICTPVSIEMAIRETLQKGLNPIKKQCFPIKMGDKLVVMPSYQGNQRAVYSSNKEVVKGSIFAQVIYKGDKVQDKIMPDGRRVVVSHTQPPFDERSDEIIGAYATVQLKLNGKVVTDTELMSIKEIKSSWAMSRGNGDVHKRFGGEMAKKTVINRLCKRLYGWTDEEATADLLEGDNNNGTQTYDIQTEDTAEEIVVDDKPQVEVVEEKSESVAEAPAKAEDGSYVISYKEYLKVKDQVEKIAYDKDSKMVTVKDKPADTTEISE